MIDVRNKGRDRLRDRRRTPAVNMAFDEPNKHALG